MNKTVKKSLIVIAIVIVAFAIIWFVYNMLKKDTVNTSSDTNIDINTLDENTEIDNIINDLPENEIENEIKENIISNSSKVNENTKQEPEKSSTAEKVTSKEEKAIELAKKKWGSTSGVYFSNEGKNSDGRYIVSVRDGKTTNSLAFYLVDVEKELVTDW